MRRFIILVFLVLINLWTTAQEQTGASVDMADTFRSNGKIYVVVAVIITIFAGIIIYLVRLDRKISKLEKQSS